MKFLKTITMISYILPLATYAASPFDAMIASLNSIDTTLTSSSSTNATTNQSLQSLNISTNNLNLTMQTLKTSTDTLNTSMQSLNTSTGTLNTTNSALNSSSQNLNQTNEVLNTNVQSLNQKINSLQGSIDSLKVSIDNLGTNAGGAGDGGSSSGGNSSGAPSATSLVFINNCNIPTPMAVTSQNTNYRCYNQITYAWMSLGRNNVSSPNSDIIFKVPDDKAFVLTDIQVRNRLILNYGDDLLLLQKVNGISSRKLTLATNIPNPIGSTYAYAYTPINFSRAQGGIIFPPGSEVILAVGFTGSNGMSSHETSIQFEMTGYLADE